MTTEDSVKAHYTTTALLERIKAAVAEAGGDPEAMKPDDLKGVDEFHTGGLHATNDLLDQLTLRADTRILDIGCGIGGAARQVAQRSGAQVTGFDLTPGYVATAGALSTAVGLGAQTTFLQGSALSMPVADASFDLALMFHVGMNIADKTKLFAEAARVLAPGGRFALFDVMRTGDGALTYPFPWADTEEFSFVDPPEVYRTAAKAAGFSTVAERARADFALDFFAKAFASIEAAGGPPPVGIHLLMRDTAPAKLRNYVAEVTAGRIAPVEMIWQKGSAS